MQSRNARGSAITFSVELSQLSPDLKVMPSAPTASFRKVHRPQPRWGDDEELDLSFYGSRLKRKRSELVSEYILDGFEDARIIREIAQKLAADHQLREAKEAVNQRLAEAKNAVQRRRRRSSPSDRPVGRAKA